MAIENNIRKGQEMSENVKIQIQEIPFPTNTKLKSQNLEICEKLGSEEKAVTALFSPLTTSLLPRAGNVNKAQQGNISQGRGEHGPSAYCLKLLDEAYVEEKAKRNSVWKSGKGSSNIGELDTCSLSSVYKKNTNSEIGPEMGILDTFGVQNNTRASRNSSQPIFSVSQQDRKCLHKLSRQKWFAINKWVQTGNYGIKAHPKQVISNPYNTKSKIVFLAKENTEEQMRGYTKIASKKTNFKNSFVIEVTISGTDHLCILDSGATKCLMSYLKFQEIFGNSLSVLKPPPPVTFYGADGNSLELKGILETHLQIGGFGFLCDMLIYTAPHREILLAYDLYIKYKFLMSESSLYVPNEIFNAQKKNIFRMGQADNAYFDLHLKKELNCAAGAVTHIEATIKQGEISTAQSELLLSNSFVCHSEDVQGITDERQLFIYYQMTNFNLEKGEFITQLLFTNKSQEYIFYPEGTLIGNAEKMCSVSGQAVQSYASDLVRHIYHVFEFNEMENKTLPSLGDFFLDSDEKKLDFSNPLCCEGNPDMDEKVKELCIKYQKVFSTNKFDIGKCNESDQVSFSMRTGTDPVHVKPYPVNQKLHKRAIEFISKLIDMGLFQPARKSESWASPCFFLLKSPILKQIHEGGSIKTDEVQDKSDELLPVRMIINYQLFNSKVKRSFSVHPQITCRDALNRLQNANYAAKLDINNCFYNLRVKPSIRGTLSFVYADMHLTPSVLMHGLIFASSLWCSVFAKVIRNAGIQGNIVFLIDDIFVISKTKKEYLQVLEKLFIALIKANFKLKFEKALFNISYKNTFKAFGWKIRLSQGDIPGTLEADPNKLAELRKLIKPKTPRDCRKFCGKFGFFSETFPNIHKILTPLFKAASQKKLIWTKECEEAFNGAIKCIHDSQVLYIPDFFKPFYLATDAARKSAVHTALYQRHPIKQCLVPIRFSSMSLQKTISMSNWSQWKAEAFALFWGCQSNYTYLALGNSFAFTDCRSLSWMAHWKFASHQVYSWQMVISQLDLQIIALRAEDPIILFSDYFTRPVQTVTKMQSKLHLLKIGNEKMHTELPVIDFSGLPPVKFANLMKCLDKFYEWVGSRSPETVKRLWQVYKSEILQDKDNNKPAAIGFCRFAKVFTYKPNLDKWTVDDPWLVRQKQIKVSQFEKIKELFRDCFPQVNKKQLRLLQEQDKLCKKFLTKPVTPFHVLQNLLFKKVNDIFLLVIPRVLTYDLVAFFHNYERCWHLKKLKLYNYLKESFLIQGFSFHYQQVMETCEFCLLDTPVKQKKPLPPGLTLIPRRPLEFWCLDYVILNSSFKKYPAMMTITCVFSQFTIFVPCSDKQTDTEFINLFQTNIIAHYGIPLSIGNDAQSTLVSSKVQIWAQLLNIQKFESTSPQGNASERQHKLIISVAKNFTRFLNITDDLMPTIACFSTILINSLKVQPHKVSPQSLVWGLKTKVPLSKYVPLSQLKVPLSSHALVRDYQKLQEIYCQIRKFLLQRNAEKEKHLESFMNHIHVSDTVLLERKQYNTKIGHKLRPRFYKVPFRVIKKYKKSALIRPLENLTLMDHTVKQRGQKLNLQKNLLVGLTRLKKLKNDLPALGLDQYESNFKILADILNKPKPPQQIRMLKQNQVHIEENKIQDFYKAINTKGLYDDRKTLFCKQNAINFAKLKGGSLHKSALISTNKSIISVQTCSYRMESLITKRAEEHTLDNETNISWIYDFINKKQKPIKMFKKSLENKDTNKFNVQSNYSDTTVRIYDGNQALGDFQNFFEVATSSNATESFHTNQSGRSQSNGSFNSTSSQRVSPPAAQRENSDISDLGDQVYDQPDGQIDDQVYGQPDGQVDDQVNDQADGQGDDQVEEQANYRDTQHDDLEQIEANDENDEISIIESNDEITITEVTLYNRPSSLQRVSRPHGQGSSRQSHVPAAPTHVPGYPTAQVTGGQTEVSSRMPTTRRLHPVVPSTDYSNSGISKQKKSLLTVEFKDPENVIQAESLHQSIPALNLPALRRDGTYKYSDYKTKIKSIKSSKKK